MPSSSSSSILVPSSACWSGRCPTVVSPMASEKSWSSMPMTDKSSGTRTPALLASKMTPMAISSEAQNSAVGLGPSAAQRRRKASWPL